MMPRMLFARKDDVRENKNAPRRCANTSEGLTHSLDCTKEKAMADSTRPRTIRKALPLSVRREVAMREGAKPGTSTPANCHVCGAPGSIGWPLTSTGKVGCWVNLLDLEFDHIVPVAHGGTNDAENIALACRYCNRSRGARR